MVLRLGAPLWYLVVSNTNLRWKTAMINHKFISFYEVQTYDLSFIHLQNEISSFKPNGDNSQKKNVLPSDAFSNKFNCLFYLLKDKWLPTFTCLVILPQRKTSWTCTSVAGWIWFTKMATSSFVDSTRMWSLKKTEMFYRLFAQVHWKYRGMFNGYVQ